MKMAEELRLPVFMIMAGGSISVILCVYGLLRLKSAPGGMYYVWMTLMASFFSFAYAAELTSSTLMQIKFWITVEYIPLPLIPAFMLLMCTQYVGVAIKKWVYYILFAIPVTTTLIQSTNELHHLYYTSVTLRENAPFPIVELTYGPWFAVHSVYLYGCIIASAAILLVQWGKAAPAFRRQLLTMAVGNLVPIIGAFLYLAGMSPYGIDLGPVFISLSFIFHSIALFRFQMFSAVPLAREMVFEHMREGVVVLDDKDIIVDYNQTVLTVFPRMTKGVIGRSASAALLDYPELAELVRRGLEFDYMLKINGVNQHFHVRFTPMMKQGMPIGRIITFANITERILMQEQLKELADTDGLTQLLNKTALLRESDRVIREYTEHGGRLSVIMFDIDLFKEVNDTYGHEAGDIVLTHVADAIHSTLSGAGFAGRYGGDEFILWLPDTSLTEACELAESIRKNIAGRQMIVEDQEVRVTSSFGVAHAGIVPGEGEHSAQSLMREADKALYTAKKSGRNSVYPLRKWIHV